MIQDLKVGNTNSICVVLNTHFYDVMFMYSSSYLPSSNFIDCFQS